jgi:hypothetical protein
MRRALKPVLLVVAVLFVWTLLGVAPSATTTGPVVVMSGLDNPRGLAIGPEGAIYVAEAGRGGAGPCVHLAGVNQLRCYGPTGAVSRYWKGKQQRVLTGLPSHANAAGEANGPNDIDFQGLQGLFMTIGFGGPPDERSAFGEVGEKFGTLMHFPYIGRPRVIADLVQFEADHNPDGGVVDSNAYGLLATPLARYVTDAGGNYVLRVGLFGHLSEVGVLPSRSTGRSTDAVPTSLVRGHDGRLYVSELTGVPFAAGAANIYRLVAGSDPVVALSGFKTIVDMAIGPDGRAYVLEHASGPVFFTGPGTLLRIETDGTRTELLTGLTRPTSVVVDHHGAIYVTNVGITPGAGEVIRFKP